MKFIINVIYTWVTTKQLFQFWPLLLSSRPGSSPPFPATAVLRLHSPRPRAARPVPASSRSLRSARGHVPPFHGRGKRDIKKWAPSCKKILPFTDSWQTDGKLFPWRTQHSLKPVNNLTSNVNSEFVTFAATSALISSCVSASLFLASSVLRSQSAMKDWRCSAAWDKTHETNGLLCV